jgi:hypothetical protein
VLRELMEHWPRRAREIWRPARTGSLTEARQRVGPGPRGASARRRPLDPGGARSAPGRARCEIRGNPRHAPPCRGCGRAEHDSCTAGVHAGEPLLPRDDWAHSCRSCGGRCFRYVDSLDEDVFGNTVAVYLRQPCGCAQELMREMTLNVAPAAPSS